MQHPHPSWLLSLFELLLHTLGRLSVDYTVIQSSDRTARGLPPLTHQWLWYYENLEFLYQLASRTDALRLPSHLLKLFAFSLFFHDCGRAWPEQNLGFSQDLPPTSWLKLSLLPQISLFLGLPGPASDSLEVPKFSFHSFVSKSQGFSMFHCEWKTSGWFHWRRWHL